MYTKQRPIYVILLAYSTEKIAIPASMMDGTPINLGGIDQFSAFYYFTTCGTMAKAVCDRRARI
jgi:hypothetical protein